ncbi:MAG: nucleotidyltransferase family protein [Bacillota bacterium]
MKDRDIRAVILAGSQNDGALSEESPERYEALVPLWGRPMVDYVMGAVIEARHIEGVVLVGFEEFSDQLDLGEVSLVRAGETFVDSIARGVAATGDCDYLFFITADVPLVTGRILDNFIEKSLELGGDFFAPVVTREVSEARYPGIERTYARLRDAELTLGNCFLGTRECIKTLLPEFDRLYSMRKSVVRMAWTIGPLFLLRLALGRATIGDAERVFGRIAGAHGRAVLSSDPEIALDVDKPSHLHALARMRPD